jgi:hypothetical protein
MHVCGWSSVKMNSRFGRNSAPAAAPMFTLPKTKTANRIKLFRITHTAKKPHTIDDLCHQLNICRQCIQRLGRSPKPVINAPQWGRRID